MSIFSFFFGRGEDKTPQPQRENPKDAQQQPDQEPSQDPNQDLDQPLTPLMDAVLGGLEEGRAKIIRFKPQDSESRSAFINALSPGDVMLADRCPSLVLENKGTPEKPVLKLLRNPLGEDLRIDEIAGHKLKLSQIEEVIAQRRPGFDLNTKDLNPAALQAAGVLLGNGALGGQFRHFAVTHHTVFSSEVDASDGRILSISAEPTEDPDGGAVVLLRVSSVFSPQADYLQVAPVGFLSEEAHANFMNAVAIANCFENAIKIKLIEDLTGS